MVARWTTIQRTKSHGSIFTGAIAESYAPFFLRSAQRFFIAKDSRRLPSGVIPPRFFPFDAAVTRLIFLVVRGAFDPSIAAMTRLSRSLSRFKSVTIFSRSKMFSSLFRLSYFYFATRRRYSQWLSLTSFTGISSRIETLSERDANYAARRAIRAGGQRHAASIPKRPQSARSIEIGCQKMCNRYWQVLGRRIGAELQLTACVTRGMRKVLP